MFTFSNLEAQKFTFTKEGSSFTAQARALNNHVTGEIYNLQNYPYLAGFL